ncbi:MAG: hypothetical protein LCH46_13140, partial [Proteobacteria bacterium]|nr:hypothetical protein [Pseudomonadota bacterium]
ENGRNTPQLFQFAPRTARQHAPKSNEKKAFIRPSHTRMVKFSALVSEHSPLVYCTKVVWRLIPEQACTTSPYRRRKARNIDAAPFQIRIALMVCHSDPS